jgi:hypothetical protein
MKKLAASLVRGKDEKKDDDALSDPSCRGVSCALCDAPIAGHAPTFMYNDRAYCCQHHRLQGWEQLGKRGTEPPPATSPMLDGAANWRNYRWL